MLLKTSIKSIANAKVSARRNLQQINAINTLLQSIHSAGYNAGQSSFV